MKRLWLLFLFIGLGFSLSGQVVIYEDEVQLAWDATKTYLNGEPINFLPGDVMNYEVYFYDIYSNPLIDDQDVSQLEFAGTTTETQLSFVFPERREWVVGVRSFVTDGSGTSGPQSLIGWSYDEGSVDVVVMGGPFRYVPLIPLSEPDQPDNLRDLRY